MSSNDRMLSVLTLFSVEQSAWTVEQAAQRLSIPVSTMYRYFASLSRIGLIVATYAGQYIVGPAALQLDWLARKTDPVSAAAVGPLRALGDALDRPGVLLMCRLYRDTVLCADQMAAGSPTFEPSYERGRPMPLFRGGSSKVILAHLPTRMLRSTYDRHCEEIEKAGLGSDWEDFRRAMSAIRRAGFCVSHGEVDRGLAGVAVPVFDPDRKLLGSLGIVVADQGIDDAVAQNLARLLRQTMDQVWEVAVRIVEQ